MKVTLIQMDSTGTREENEKKALEFMEQAIAEKIDIICLSKSFVYQEKEQD